MQQRQPLKSLLFMRDPMVKGVKGGVKDRVKGNGREEVEDNRDKSKAKAEVEDSSIAQRYMHMGRIYRLQKRALAVRF